MCSLQVTECSTGLKDGQVQRIVRKATSLCCWTQWAAEHLGAATLPCGHRRASPASTLLLIAIHCQFFVENKCELMYVLQVATYNSFCHCALPELKVS